MGKLYGLSERDYDRVQRAIRKIESLNPMLLLRRFPVFSGVGGWPIPTGTVTFLCATSRILVRETHQCKWCFFCNNGDPPYNTPGGDFDLVLPPNPTVGDFYFFMAHNYGTYYVRIYGNNTVSQKIIMPTEEWTGTSKAIALDWNADSPWPGGMNQLILACNGPNQWICVDSQHSNISEVDLPA
jgi:hypothetical protein